MPFGAFFDDQAFTHPLGFRGLVGVAKASIGARAFCVVAGAPSRPPASRPAGAAGARWPARILICIPFF